MFLNGSTRAFEPLDDCHWVLHHMKPIAISFVSPRCCCKKCLLYPRRYRAAPAHADYLVIDFAHGSDLGCGAGKECFVRTQQIVQCQCSDFGLVAKVVGYPKDRITRYTQKNRMLLVIGTQLVVAHEKQILSGSFGYVSCRIKQ